MSSSATGSTGADAGDGEGAAAPGLERSVERLDQGVVVTYELRAEAEDAMTVDLQQPLPPELTVADVGFRTDAAPAEWSVEGDLVRGSGTVPGDGSVEYVLGLKLPEAPEELPTFPEPELTGRSDGGADGESDDEAATDPTAVDLGAADETTSDDPGEQATDAEEPTEGPSLVGNTDGELAESVREVIGGAGSGDRSGGAAGSGRGEAGAGERTGATTDGGPEATGTGGDPQHGPDPRQNPATGDDLEAAVAAVEPEIEDGQESTEGDDGPAEEPPELDLSIPEVGEGTGETDGTETDGPDAAGTETDPEADTPSDESTLESTTAAGDGSGPVPGAAADTPASPADIAGFADRLAAADEADRRAVQEALGLDRAEDDGAPGTVTVRLEQVESRLSAFEAYEDALAEFIDETGTVEEVEATATEAAEAADELRVEVGELREEVESARESVEAAKAERAALRRDLDALRGDVDEALALREQLLGALQNAGGAAGAGAATSEDGGRSPGSAE